MMPIPTPMFGVCFLSTLGGVSVVQAAPLLLLLSPLLFTREFSSLHSFR